MRYRKKDTNWDRQFGRGLLDFWHDTPEAVGQAIKSRLWLFRGEWFLATQEGMPWGGFPINDDAVLQGRVLGKNTEDSRDMAIKVCVLDTEGVLALTDYSSDLDSGTRRFVVRMVVNTIYGRIAVSIGGQPTQPGFTIGVSAIGGGMAL
jgi:hypothetical protein